MTLFQQWRAKQYVVLLSSPFRFSCVLLALDGVSLTVNEVDGDEFEILLIPHTLAVTTWGERKVSDVLNLEVDTMARYAERILSYRGEPARGG